MRHAFALVLLLTLAAVPVAAAQPQENYYPVGRFAVAAPDNDVQYLTSIVEHEGSAVIHHDFTMTDQSGNFKVMVLFVNLGTEPSAEVVDAMFRDAFADIAQDSLDNGSATLVSRDFTPWENWPAMDFTLQLQTPSGERWLMVRAVVAGSRFYVLRASAPAASTCERVLKSFWVAP